MSPLDQAETYLAKVGLLHRPGAVLYASSDTLKPGPVYLLGINPGGSGSATLQHSLQSSRAGANAYLDEAWSSGGRHFGIGRAPLQQRIQGLCATMGLETQAVPASNLAFTRSTEVSTHDNFRNTVKLCMPVHEIFDRAIQPGFLLTYGALSHLQAVIDVEEAEPRSGEFLNYVAYRGRLKWFGRRIPFATLTHMSRWPSNAKPHIVKWALEDFPPA